MISRVRRSSFLHISFALFLVFLLFSGSNLSGTDWTGQIHELDSLISTQQYNDVIVRGEYILKQSESEAEIDSVSLGLMLAKIAYAYYNLAKLETAAVTYERAIPLLEGTLGLNNPDVLTNYIRYTSICRQLYRRDDAIRHNKHILAEVTFDIDSLKVKKIDLLTQLGQIYWESGKSDSAEYFCQQAVDFAKKEFGDENRIIVSSLITLANIKDEIGKYFEAEKLFKQAISILENGSDPDDPKFIPCYYYYGIFLSYINKTNAALEYFLKTKEYIERIYGAEHPFMIPCLIHLGCMFEAQREVVEAKQIFQQALTLYRSSYEGNHPYLSMILGNLAQVYTVLGENDLIVSCLREKISVDTDLFGANSKEVFYSYMELTMHNYASAENSMAKRNAAKALDVFTNIINRDTLYRQDGLQLILELCRNIDEFPVGDSEYQRSIERLIEYTAGFDTYYSFMFLLQLSDACLLGGYPNEGIELRKYFYKFEMAKKQNKMEPRTDMEILRVGSFMDQQVGIGLGAYFDMEENKDGINSDVMDIVVLFKGYMKDQFVITNLGKRNCDDLHIQAQYDSLDIAKNKLSSLLNSNDEIDFRAEWPTRDSLQSRIEQIEKDINRRYSELGLNLQLFQPDVETIQSCVPPRSVVIEYLNYDKIVPQTSDDSDFIKINTLVAAYDNTDILGIVDLGLAEDIEGKIKILQDQMNSIAEEGGVPTNADISEFKETSHSLYSMIWAPVMRFIKDKDLILISPDGCLNSLSFATLIDDDGEFLIETAPLHYISSGANLVYLCSPQSSSGGMLAFGAPDCNTTIAASKLRSLGFQGSDNPFKKSDYDEVWECGNLADIHLQPIPGADNELRSVAQYCRSEHQDSVQVILARDATESRFKAAAVGKKVIHLATHGYYLNCEYQLSELINKFNTYDFPEPSLYSGLFFNEVNDTSKSNKSDYRDDGILTAYEVSTLDLRGTDLVVLSACQSGLGHIYNGHESFGLAWAFRKAGVRTFIGSLWSVSDEYTPEMFEYFYAHRSDGIANALRGHQLKTISEMRAQGEFPHPVNWGAFIAIGDWR